MRQLEEHEVVMWCDGFDAGKLRGIEQGKSMQKKELRRILGLQTEIRQHCADVAVEHKLRGQDQTARGFYDAIKNSNEDL